VSRDNPRDHSLGWPYPIDVRVRIRGSVVGCAVWQVKDAGEQLDAADEVGALRDRLAPPSQLIRVFCGRGPAVEKQVEATEEAGVAKPWRKGSRTWLRDP
jgi:hypothetical protein